MEQSMALREGALNIKFAGGVETKMDAKAVPSTRLLTLENGVFTRAISIRKRNGYRALGQVIDGDAGLLDDGIRLATRSDELLEFTPTRCFSQQAESDQWSDAGPVMSVPGTDRPLIKTGTQQLQPDSATLAGVSAVAWEDSIGGVWWSTIDAATGRIHRAATQADGLGRSPRCVPCGTNLHIYYVVPSQRRIMVLVVNPAAPAAALTPAILTDDLSATNPVYDACPTERSATPAAIAWLEQGTTNIRLGYVDASGALGSPATGHPSVLTYAANVGAASPLSVAHLLVDDGALDRFGLTYINGSNHGVAAVFFGGSGATAIVLADFADVYAATSVLRVAMEIVADLPTLTLWSAFEEAAAEPSNRRVAIATFETNATVITAVRTIRSVGLASRAFAVNGDVFATFVHDTTYFNTYVTLRWSDALAIGRHVPGSAAGAPLRPHLSSAHLVGDVVSIALPVRTRLLSENGDQFTETGLRLLSLDFDSPTSHQTAQLGAGLYMAGACAQHYDGRGWTEQGFHFGPELVEIAQSSGGDLTPDATYEYRFWYEWTDAQGEVHRGPTSVGTLVVLTVTSSLVEITLPTLRVTSKTNVRIGVARSLAAETGDTARLFRVSSLDPNTEGDANGYVRNSTTADTVTFTDSMSDDILRLQEELYTDGGILSNDPAALGPVIAGGKSRLFFTDTSDGNVIRYSQVIDDGYGVECPPDLTVKVDPFGGPITALAIQDDRVVVFKAGAIFLFQGDGPLPNGDTATAGFTAPQLVTSDVGCTDPSSIVLTPTGHMFKSAKGIYLLDRSGSVSYVGAPVERYNAQSVRRATVMPDRTQVVFLCDTGLTLLYDYLFGQWSTFTNHTGLDAAVVRGAYHYLRTDGRVFRETIGEYSDAGIRIRIRFETAWIHMQEQLQGFQRFWRLHLLGTWISAHQLGIQYQTDYTPGWSNAVWLDATGLSSAAGWITGFGAATIGVEPISGTDYGDGEYGDGPYGGAAQGVYQWRHHLNEKGQAIQFRFEDFEADGFTGASFELTEMLITGGIKGNAPRPFTAGRST
jgi:hypothetical protein